MKFKKLLSKKNLDVFGTKQVTIAFLGDSITQGCFEVYKASENGVDAIHDYEHVYHAKLKKMFNKIFPVVPLNIINAGISGGSAPNGFERLERDVLEYSPDLVVVCFGLNDVHGGMDNINTYANALQSIFKSLKERKIETIFLTPNMMNTNISPHITDDHIRCLAEESADIQNQGIMDAYIQCAISICKEEDVPICDCYKKWKQLNASGVDITDLLSNYLNHPIRDMHLLFASCLFNMIMFSE